MRNVAILFKKSQEQKDITPPRKFTQILNSVQGPKQEINYSIIFQEDIQIKFKERVDITFNEKNLLDFDGVFFRTPFSKTIGSINEIICEYLKSNSRVVLNPPLTKSLHSDKAFQAFIFSNMKLTLPETIFIKRESLVDKLPALKLKLPFVVKSIYGMKGQDNYLIRAMKEVKDIIEKTRESTEFVLQEYIPNRCDYRIGVIGNEISFAVKRTRHDPDDHRNNISVGATSERVDSSIFPDEVIDTVYKLNRKFKFLTAGFDFVKSEENGKWYILEVNPSPGIDPEDKDSFRKLHKEIMSF